MSILQQSQLPTYSESQVLKEASLQQSLLSLSQGSGSNIAQTLHLQNDAQQTASDVANFDTFKQNIYRHPLFPLLAMMFEKCETSTYSPDAASHSFEKELQAVIKHQESLKGPILCPDEEVNELMIKAIQVLRIHLMEMEKVNELCKDFCSRYISCLKSKLTSEQLLHVDGCDSPEPQDLTMSSSNVVNMNPSLPLPPPAVVTPTVVGGSMVLQQQQQPQIVSGNTVYQMVHTPQGIVAQPIQIQGPLTPLNQPVHQVIHGSTPLSQIGVSLTSPIQQHHMQQPTVQQPQQQNQQSEIKSGHLRVSDDEDDDKNSKQKRGILPKQATQVMKSWLFQHIVHPYPTEDEKRQIASQTNLTLLQVNNWFINARRRILQPMLEASNPEKAKSKKPSKPGNKPQQRFWPILPNSQSKENYDADEEEGKSKQNQSTPKKTTAAPVAATPLPTSERLQPVVSSEPSLSSQQEAYMGYMPNNFVLRLGPDHMMPNNAMANAATSITLENLQNLQALQSSGFLFTHGPPSLPFSLPLSALSPSSSAALGLGMGSFSNLGPSPMALGALNFTSYSAPLQFASYNTAPIDLSAMANQTTLQLSALAGTISGHHLNNGQLLMGMSTMMSDQQGDQSYEDADESLEAGELKIDTKDVSGGGD
ncbi:homeobox protein PKNOX1-like [Biomphalaria glabrata]|uniref:Homeobox protein PKNOX1-like n=1 Tax=Biomphalaria glabrata TaxID=6526 RepID=A0A9U8DYR9_BIOGL|nr:homeobox protein PKNOX1-like [Biomphalaria glabrata]XP_013066813.2 homeobox protein PKNOX1-like [Biomphalaria glabrata]XP_013066814.2 homeobox protein PKNOX1-like [Biomphalaria glabrata]KAI8734702.1 homeobox protein PKNOX1-like [Biomphalaria glabrata]